MKTIKLFITAITSLILLANFAAAADGWLTDIDTALKKAKAENKAVFVEFTGSDWCPPCKMMEKNVFSKKDFINSASEKVVLVQIDLPNKDKALAQKNAPIVQKYGVQGFPSVVLLDGNGEKFSLYIASEFPNVKSSLAKLNSELEKKDMD